MPQGEREGGGEGGGGGKVGRVGGEGGWWGGGGGGRMRKGLEGYSRLITSCRPYRNGPS